MRGVGRGPRRFPGAPVATKDPELMHAPGKSEGQDETEFEKAKHRPPPLP